MDTDTLRSLTAEAATTARGRLWPNGLGFDRGGWTYVYLAQRTENHWCASHRTGMYAGDGPTPAAARLDALKARGRG